MEDGEIISFVEDFVSDKRIRNLILVVSSLFVLFVLYALISLGYEGMLKEFQQLV
jgi:hypothetical protein